MGISKLKIANGETKWQVRVWENGRGSRRINRRFDRRTDAEAFLLQFESKIEEERKSPFKGCSFEDRTFADEAANWLRDGELRFSPSHLVRVKGVLKEVLPRFGDLTMDKFTPEFLATYQQEEKARGLENASVNRKTEVFTTILNFAVKQRRIPFSPANGFRKLRKSTTEMEFWDQVEAAAFLTFANMTYPKDSTDRWVYVVYLLALNTAMRAGEIWGLKPSDLSRDGRSIQVRRQFNRVTLEMAPTKSKKSRLAPLNDELREELEHLIKIRSIEVDETIFMNVFRNPICHENFVKRQFLVDVKAWGGRSIRFHDLRHSATTMMIAGGIDLKTVKEICGHADIATTMTYVHLISGAVERVAQVFSVTRNVQQPQLLIANARDVTESQTETKDYVTEEPLLAETGLMKGGEPI